MEKRIVLIDGKDVDLFFETLDNLGYIYQKKLPRYRTPYNEKSWEISFDRENEWQECLKILGKYLYEIQFYHVRNGYYEPFVLDDVNYPYKKTTFFYQMLAYPERFISNIDAFLEHHFLEKYTILCEDKKGVIYGYYRAVKHYPISNRIVQEENGLINIKKDLLSNGSIIKTKIENNRNTIWPNCEVSPYDELFGFQEGITEIEITEYFIKGSKDFVIHYGENIDRIEIYPMQNGIMLPTPSKVFQKSQENLGLMEQEILRTIELFTKSGSILKRKKN